MEMNYYEFLEALEKHFEDESRGNGRNYIGEWADSIAKNLRGYMKQMGRTSSKGLDKVHIGHVFGPFGFEIKKEK